MNKIGEGAGFTIEQFLKIVIAVAVITVLFYFAFKLYGVFSTSTRIEQADAKVDEIISKLNYMNKNKNKNNEGSIFVGSPKDWYLIKIVEGDLNKLCICEELKINSEEQKQVCVKRGVCKAVDKDILFEIKSIVSVTEGANNEKIKAIKIGIGNLGIQESEGIFYLTGGTDASELNKLLAEFLLTSFSVSETEPLDKISVGDLVKKICDETLGKREAYKNQISSSLEYFFKDKVSEGEYFAFSFKSMKEFAPLLNNCAEVNRGLYLKYPDKNIFPKDKGTDCESGTEVYDSIVLDNGKYCMIYLKSNKNF